MIFLGLAADPTASIKRKRAEIAASSADPLGAPGVRPSI